MPDRSKVKRQTKRDTGVYAARGRWKDAPVHQTPGPREPFKRDAADLAPRAIAGAGGVISQ